MLSGYDGPRIKESKFKNDPLPGFQVEGGEFAAKRAVKNGAVLEKRLDQNVDSPLFMRREMEGPVEGQRVCGQACEVQFPDGAGRVLQFVP